MSTEETNYQEEYEKVKEELETLKTRYFKAREEGIKRENYAALLSGNKTMKVYRKLQVKAGHGDPFIKLRPHLSQAEAEILYNIDNQYYKNENLVLRGWSYDLCGLLS